MTTAESLWSKLASQVEVVIPAAWAGLFAVLLAAYCDGARAHKLLEDIGGVLIMPVVFFVGLVLFLLYRVIIGEWVLYPLRHGLHALIDWAWRRIRRKPDDFISFTQLLARLGVSFGHRRQVYSAIRDREGVFEPRDRDRLDFLHATYHLFYITALELLAAAAYRWTQGENDWRVFGVLGVVSMVMVFTADIKQDIWECWLLRRRISALRPFLDDLGFPVPSASGSASFNNRVNPPTGAPPSAS